MGYYDKLYKNPMKGEKKASGKPIGYKRGFYISTPVYRYKRKLYYGWSSYQNAKYKSKRR